MPSIKERLDKAVEKRMEEKRAEHLAAAKASGNVSEEELLQIENDIKTNWAWKEIEKNTRQEVALAFLMAEEEVTGG